LPIDVVFMFGNTKIHHFGRFLIALFDMSKF